ncbi:MAG: hypothetical protein Q4D03_00770 [Bacteroidales bacterium]|nr:hypothetical protein [Bacteroidales bacterium]
MKKRNIILILSLLLVVVIFGACQKSRYCLCITNETTPPDTVIVNMERGKSCSRIVNMGFEELNDGQTQVTTHSYTCEKIKKDTVPTYHNLPYED